MPALFSPLTYLSEPIDTSIYGEPLQYYIYCAIVFYGYARRRGLLPYFITSKNATDVLSCADKSIGRVACITIIPISLNGFRIF